MANPLPISALNLERLFPKIVKNLVRPRDKFFHIPGVVARVGIPSMPILSGQNFRQTIQTGSESSNAVKIAYSSHGRQQRMNYGGHVRAHRQILSYTRGAGMCGGPLGANAWWLTCQTDLTDWFSFH